MSVRGPARIFKRVLVDHGYLKSSRAALPVDGAGRPVPWYTFPAVEYLDQFDFSGWRVFEFGSGNSTRWWLASGADVTAVEHDREWFERMRPDVERAGGTYRFAADRDAYVGAVDDAAPYDVVVVDGFWRGRCADAALRSLSPRGFVIVDNSDWFPDIAERLRAGGLLEVDFHGFIPLNDTASTTSLFLRREVELVPRTGSQPVPPRGGVAIPAWRRRWFLEDPEATPD